jgi:hypothetical protein
MSTYSPDLRIELITTGDQAGVWGATTNNNLAYVVEQAIAGYVSVSVISANQAFTYLNGGSSTAAANQAVHAAIALTTTTGANFAVYAPPASKQYTIYNASAYTATIYNSTVIGNTTAAGTGVAIPAGKTTTVWSDGTNFSFQNTYLAPVIQNDVYQSIANLLYPVGSIYTNSSSGTNPATLFGFGTWVAFGAGRVMIGNGGGFSAGGTGGSADATLVSHNHTGTTGGQSAGHFHGFSAATDVQGNHNHNFVDALIPMAIQSPQNRPGLGRQTYNQDTIIGGPHTTDAGSHQHSVSGNTGGVSADHDHSFTTTTAGGSATNANLQPYIVVYMWQRTA